MMAVNRTLSGLAMTLALVVPSERPANAQMTRLQTATESSWSHNISKADQDTAEEALQEGNRLMKGFAYAKAEAKYREALKHWDHPGLHYNLALTLLQLDRPVEVYEHLVKALEGGEAALGIEKKEHARLHKEALEKQLAKVELVCDVPGATVRVGGQELALINGRYEGLMRPGPVILEGNAPDYLPREKKFDLSPGQLNSLDLKLYKGDELVAYEPRWTPWIPRVFLGAGGVLAAGGGLLYWQTRQGYRSFDTHVSGCSSGAAEPGCREPDLASRRGRLETLNKVSFGAMAVSGAALATGTVLFFLNRDQAHPISPDELDLRQGLTVTPVLGRGANGVLLTLQY